MKGSVVECARFAKNGCEKRRMQAAMDRDHESFVVDVVIPPERRAPGAHGANAFDCVDDTRHGVDLADTPEYGGEQHEDCGGDEESLREWHRCALLLQIAQQRPRRAVTSTRVGLE